MKRPLAIMVVVVCAAVIVAAAAVVACWPRPPQASPAEPVAVHYSDLPRSVYRHGTHRGATVRVAYPFRLHATDDPLAWEFRPGSSGLPPTHRIHFEDTPQFPERLPVVVVGVVEGVEPDLVIRPNGVPGVVVIRAARVVRASSP